MSKKEKIEAAAEQAKPSVPVTNLNREISFLMFNKRVLAQAQDESIPLLERLKYLCIVSSNLDEFFEIRMAGLKEQQKLAGGQKGQEGKTVAQAIEESAGIVRGMVKDQYELFNSRLLPELERNGVLFLRRSDWSDPVKAWLENYFDEQILPLLSPIIIDPQQPFPKVLNKSLNLLVELEGRDAFGRNPQAAIVQAPRALARLIKLPGSLGAGENTYVFLSSVLHGHLSKVFYGMGIKAAHQFRVTRNSDLFIDEEESENLRERIKKELPSRHFGEAVRLEVANTCSDELVDFLCSQLNLGSMDAYKVDGPVNLSRLMNLPDLAGCEHLRFEEFTAGIEKFKKAPDIFGSIKKGDILLHHPYQSFEIVEDFLEAACSDPNVLSVKITIYRTGKSSKLMESLLKCAKAGKEVTAVFELLARFDEEANIHWATKLEEAGAHVLFGALGHKTHAKMMLLSRKEGNGPLRRYLHLSTGNYNGQTAKLYTDFGLLTAQEEMCSDAEKIFRQLTGSGKVEPLARLWQSPFGLQKNLLAGIQKECENAKKGLPASITAKMNSLLDPKIISALYEASQCGVKVDLIIRGVCALRPGVAGLSENITVKSIVGRFLEHHRVWRFEDGGDEKVYLSSADWMERNFARRIELAFPVLGAKLKRRVVAESLQAALKDNVNSWRLNCDGTWSKQTAQESSENFCMQLSLCNKLGTLDVESPD